MTVAAVTMVFNEPAHLPLWARHYARQVGARNCYVIDHGSDDGSTAGLGEINVISIPRSAQDDERRARFLSQFCASLLAWHDWVVHSDVDELVLADPDRHATLADYCAAPLPDVVTAIGFNLHHLPDTEPPLDLARPVTAQRRWARFGSAMCKPVLIRRAVDWVPGFHCTADAPVAFDRLFLFHLRWFDRALGLARLAKTRTMPWADAAAGAWQRVQDAEFAALMDRIAGLPQRRGLAFDPAAPPLSDALHAVLESRHGRERQRYKIDLHLDIDELWELPARFRGAF
ncbi:MAG: glycosyltransferase family 2 protein [Alphaproteobacteria bacterium]|nr:glycosyltransferase family 2 protein [Alphaproteobacteria bacterium]